MISVQAEGCAPVVRAFEADERFAEPWEDADTRASGIRVPSAVGDFLILDALRESEGMAVAVDEQSIAEMQIFAGYMGAGYVSPESAVALAAVPELRERGEISRDTDIVVFDCGIGQKYPPPPGLPDPLVVDPSDYDLESQMEQVDSYSREPGSPGRRLKLPLGFGSSLVQDSLDQVVHSPQDESDQQQRPRPQEGSSLLLR